MLLDHALMIHYEKQAPNHCIHGYVNLLHYKNAARYAVYNAINLHACMYTLVGRISHNEFLSAPFYYAAIFSPTSPRSMLQRLLNDGS